MMQNTDNGKILFYMHAGSGNHGCEAIVNALCRMLPERPDLLSYRTGEDRKYTLSSLCGLHQERSFEDHKIAHLFYYGYRKLSGDRESFIRYRYGDFLSKKKSGSHPALAVSIGGDNYCYDTMLNDLFLANAAFNRQATKTVLLGCSVEPELLKRKDILEDLGKYHTIIARESITHEALKEAFGEGAEEGEPAGNKPELLLIPDPAFTLPAKKESALPGGLIPGNTVGINVSPLVSEHEASGGMVMEAYRKLVRTILEETDMGIALIPHVVWENNDDRKPLTELLRYAKDLGFEERIAMAEDADCETLKGIISKCRLFVGARTHATIAAYSTFVPTLVAGYSVKAAGIAKDLFPGWDPDELVRPVQGITRKEELAEAFRKLCEREEEIRAHLQKTIPGYVEKAYGSGKVIRELAGK